MEVRTVLASLLSRFWFDLAPAMGKAEAVRRNQQIALTLKIKGGLQLVCHPHDSGRAGGGGGVGGRRGAAGGVGAGAGMGSGSGAVERAASGAAVVN